MVFRSGGTRNLFLSEFVAIIAGIAALAPRQISATPQPSAAANGRAVIVTPERFKQDLQPFVEYRSRDLSVECVTLEAVLKGAAGVDDPEKLKRFLYRAWKERHARYVLLVGDASVLPVRYMVLDRITPAAFDYAFYPSDLYYGSCE
jgi:hypothetical protein